MGSFETRVILLRDESGWLAELGGRIMIASRCLIYHHPALISPNWDWGEDTPLIHVSQAEFEYKEKVHLRVLPFWINLEECATWRQWLTENIKISSASGHCRWSGNYSRFRQHSSAITAGFLALLGPASAHQWHRIDHSIWHRFEQHHSKLKLWQTFSESHKVGTVLPGHRWPETGVANIAKWTV
jgi:hypothetical protein